MNRFRPAVAVAALLALPIAAGWVFLPAPGGRVEGEPEPDVFESELEPYDWNAVSEGDWVEHEVSTASPLDESSRVRTRMACVKVAGGTAWVESRDHLVARFFPGCTVLCEVERSTGRIARAWWGAAGSVGEPVEVRRAQKTSGRGGVDRYGIGEAATLAVAGFTLPCTRMTLRERLPGGDWSSQSAVWLAPKIPFPRRACVAAGNDQVAWTGAPGRGGVAWEEFAGLSVRMTSEVVAWGQDAKPSLRAK
jgi:hypothetical protein